MSKKKADKKKGGFVRAIRNIFVFLIASALLGFLGLTGIYIYVKHDVNPRLLEIHRVRCLGTGWIRGLHYTKQAVHRRY